MNTKDFPKKISSPNICEYAVVYIYIYTVALLTTTIIV